VLNGCYYRNSGSYDASKFAFDKNRHYLTYDGAPYYGNLSISTVPPTPQIPTTVDGVVADDKQSDSIYTLDGRHLNAPLQRGVFIRNGKKVGRR